MQRAWRELIAAVATGVALACGDGSSEPEVPGSIQVSVTPATLPVTQGSTGTVTASLTRGGGFPGVVTLAVSGLPAGLTATITPTQLSGATTSATIEVTATAAVAPQTYTATITATAQGVAQATTTYQVTVTALPNYALSVAPATLPIAAGASGSFTVAIDRTNFTGGVALTLLNPPTGITGVFTPTPSTTNSSALAVSVAANVAPGAHSLTIQGTATGPGTRTATLTVTVTAPVGPTDVEYRFCDDDAPDFFAYQDGGGSWQRLAGTTAGTVTRFAFPITQGRGGVLMVYGPADGVYDTQIRYASGAELAQDGRDNCVVSQPTKTITATVVGVTPGQYGIVSLGGVTDIFNGGVPRNPLTFRDVPGGLVDMTGSRVVTPGTPPDRLIIRRNLDLPDGGSIGTVDYTGAGSFAPAVANVNISGGAGDALEVYSDLVTANGASLLWADMAPSPNASRPWVGATPAAMVSGDLHALTVFATPAASPGEFRVAVKYVGPIANEAIVFGPKLTAPALSMATAGAYPRLRIQGTLPAAYNKGIDLFVQGGQGSGNTFYIVATGAWLGVTGSAVQFDLVMPDVSGLAGFPVASRLASGMNDVSLSAFWFNGPGLFELRPNLGSEAMSATKGATITVP